MIGHNNPPEKIDADKAASGWVKIYRDIRRHPIVGFGQPVKPADPELGSYSRSEAFQDLIMEAQYESARVFINGEMMALGIGQLIAARAYLASRWNWTEKTVRTFLDHLAADGMIERGQPNGQLGAKSNKRAPNVITICKYEKFQAYKDAIVEYVQSIDRPAEWPTRGQLGANQGPAKGQNLRTKEINIHDTREGAEVRKDQFGRPIEGPEADVSLAGDRITLVNGARSRWLEKFDGDANRLDLALIQIAGYVQPNSARPLAAQVESQLARIVSDKADRDRRYAAAAAAKPHQSATAPPRPTSRADEQKAKARALMSPEARAAAEARERERMSS